MATAALDHFPTLPGLSPGPVSPGEDQEGPRFIKAEVNLLRLPLFALQTKGLRQLDGFECHGTIRRDGQTHQYTWRVTRHATRPFPGPLARAAHLAFLSILTEAGPPFENPVRWSWRDLCRRIGITCSGRTVENLKEAIRATAGLIVESSRAVYIKSARELTQLDEDDRHVYVRVRFHSRKQPDGETLDRNQVWLARWYLDNLNTLYTAPLDHDLWRYLDRKSPIASRLYEYLLPSLFRPGPCLRIGYPLLAQSLPVRLERYYSDARKQMGAPLELLAAAQVLGRTTWAKRKAGVAQLCLYRGPRLAAVRPVCLTNLAEPEDGLGESLEVHQLRGPRQPERELVTAFYRHRWGSGLYRPNAKELTFARTLLDQYGEAKAKRLLPLLADRIRQAWPEAKTFLAVERYLPEVSREHDQRERQERQQREAKRLHQEEQQQAEAERARRRQFLAIWQVAWDQLSPSEQQEIQCAVLAKTPILHKLPSVCQERCLEELARRMANGPQE